MQHALNLLDLGEKNRMKNEKKDNENVVTLKDLEQYRALYTEMTAIDLQIKSLYNTYHSPSFSNEGGFSYSDKSNVEMAVSRIMELEEKFNIKKNNLINKATNIEKWLETVSDQYVRACIRYHYMLGYTWRETTIKVYGGNNNDQNSKRVVRRYFGLDKRL